MNRHAVIFSLLLAASGCTTTAPVGTTPRPSPAPAAARAPAEPAPSTAQREAQSRLEVERRPEARVPPDDRIFRMPDDAPYRSNLEPLIGEPAPPAPTVSAPASAALLEQSRGQRAAGSYTAAASSIERALRIEPNNPNLWLELGEIKLADDDPQQAEQMARKAMTLAGGDRGVTTRAERLLARAASCVGASC